jgi:hypothetical protein
MPKKQNSSTAGGGPNSGSGPKNGKKATRIGKTKPGRRKSFLANVVELIRMTYFGRIFWALLLAGIVCLINILLSGNQFELFFQITGIELILAAIIMWLRFLLRRET